MSSSTTMLDAKSLSVDWRPYRAASEAGMLQLPGLEIGAMVYRSDLQQIYVLINGAYPLTLESFATTNMSLNNICSSGSGVMDKIEFEEGYVDDKGII